MKPGKIVIGIDQKLYFEPDGLPEPNQNDYEYYDGWLTEDYQNDYKKYEASKQLIEVVNNYFLKGAINDHVFKDNQICKAEITGDKATIVEIVKEATEKNKKAQCPECLKTVTKVKLWKK